MCNINSIVNFVSSPIRDLMNEYYYYYQGAPAAAALNIPLQLQRVFAQLQTSGRRAVDTTALTRSFGWDSSEARQQHDVQVRPSNL